MVKHQTLLSVGTNPKTSKSDALGEYVTAILYLAPHTVSSRNACAWAGDCAKDCLFYAGRGAMQSVQQARIKRTEYYWTEQYSFVAQLKAEIALWEIKALREGKKLAVRLNGTSDILWDKKHRDIFDAFPNVTFYDYSKRPLILAQNLPQNYSLTFSYSESMTDADLNQIIQAGHSVAAVFDTVPDSFKGLKVVNGDAHDLRFTDPKGVIVGLTAKGRAKKTSGQFVQKAR